MKPYQVMAHINSLKGEMAEVTILDKPDDNVNQYIVDYRGVKCLAIFNWLVCEFYVDDIYGIIREDQK